MQENKRPLAIFWLLCYIHYAFPDFHFLFVTLQTTVYTANMHLQHSVLQEGVFR